MPMKTTLEQAFNAYLSLARADLRPQQVTPAGSSPIRLLETRSMELRRLVDGIEESPEFSELVNATEEQFPRESNLSHYVVDHLGAAKKLPPHHPDVRNFFRRSGYYNALHGGNDVDVVAALGRFVGEFRKDEIQIRYLVALGGINFQLNANVMEFERFKLRRFSSEELKEIFQNDVNDIFYQSKTLSRDDLMFSEPYWFIDVLGFEPREEGVAKSDEINNDLLPLVEEEFGAFPKTVASVLDPFILCDWNSFDPLSPTFEFSVPFILEISNDLRDEPRKVPAIVGMCGGDGDYDIDWDVELNGVQSSSFHHSLSQLDSILARLRFIECEWRFLDVALLFYRYAFVARGRQQLLSHVMVLEALLGEKGKEGLTMRNRLAFALGETDREREDEIRKSFKDLYELRSRLVHGDEKVLDQRTMYTHLREARNLARRTLVWFLHYLGHVELTRNGRPRPTRKKLLNVLDPQDRSSESVKDLLENLPPDFPSTRDWLC